MDTFPADIEICLNGILQNEDCPDASIRRQAAVNTYDWLIIHGYIGQKSSELGLIKRTVYPTEKLLVLMDAIPSALSKRKQTLQSFFAENAKTGVGESVQQAVQMLLQMGAKLVLS